MTSLPTPHHHPTETSRDCLCPVCLSPSVQLQRPGKDRLFNLAKGTFNLCRCTSCRCIFQNPLPESSVLATYYPQEYWWSEDSSNSAGGKRLFVKLEKAYRNFVTGGHARFLADCAREKPQGGKLLLDIGCGNGTFLAAARAKGFEPHGMDASARAVEIARQQSGCPVRQGEIGSDAWEGSHFDFVTMFHVLEHLPDPRIALRFARELLRPGGRLIIQVPNISSVQARIFGNRWYGLDVPRHVINYTPRSLEFLLRECGFEFRLYSRFSLRDNPASLASSLAPWMDPIHRKGMRLDSSPTAGGIIEVAYLGLCLLSLPAAWLESVFGAAGTLWVCAWI